MAKIWKILKLRELDQESSKNLPEALETNFKWFLSQGKWSEAIWGKPKISQKMEPTGRQMVEISRCRYAAAQCQNKE